MLGFPQPYLFAAGLSQLSEMPIDVRMYGAKCDGVALYDAASTASSSSVISSATARFSKLDIGKACAILPYSDTGLTPRWGTIVSVTDENTVVTSLSASPGSLSGAMFVYGTDDSTALDAALAASAVASYRGCVQIPLGITVTTGLHTLPSGCTLQGVTNNATGGKAKDFRLYGSSIVSVKSNPSNALITLGTLGSSDPRGSILRNLNVDCLNLNINSVAVDGGRTNHIYGCTLVRGIQETIKNGPTSRIYGNCIIGQNAWNTVQLGGDASFMYNIVTGAGNGYYGIKTSNGDDILIIGNHIWKDSAASSMLGGSIWASWFSGSLAGSVNISNNKCDTNYGSAIKLTVSGSSTQVRSVNIHGNDCFNNDSVANNTGPVIELSVAATCIVKGLSIQANTARGSWNNQSLGQWSALIDGSAISGNIYGAVVGGNVAVNCNALYASFTPDHDNGNISIAGTGTTQTKSVTT